MKKIILAASLTALSFTSLAATTATLLLKGKINPIVSIQVTPEAIATTLDLTTTQASTKVATVQEKSNISSGYKVTISSQNQGALKNDQHSMAYSMSYGGQVLNLASPVTQTNSATTAVAVNKNVTISYTGVPAEQLVAGDYTDTITFTIAPN